MTAQFMVIGEHPNKEDAKSGRPFSARKGRQNEIDRYLDGAGCPAREDCYLTYWIKEWAGEEGEYLTADYNRDLLTLIDEVWKVQPDVIITLGRPVTQLFLGDVDLESCYAIPWYLPVSADARAYFRNPESTIIFPNYNPAAGFRSPEIAAQVTYGFAQLEALCTGTLTPRVLFADPIPQPHYEEITNPALLDQILAQAVVIGTDTEGWAHQPWSVQISIEDGRAYVLRAANRECISRFVTWVNAHSHSIRFIFHSALHDLGVFRAMGIDTVPLQYDDTAIMSYNLQLEPPGLKPLCARWCNMRMEHYEEVMGDAENELARDWLFMVWENEEVAYESRCQEEFTRLTSTPYLDARGTLQPGRRLKVLPKLPKNDLHKSVERCLRSKTPRKLWDDQVLDRHVDADPCYGSIWQATLDHVPHDRAISYAARDADGTHRLYPPLYERLEANGLVAVYQADLGTVPLIDRMQKVGIRPDLGHFAVLSADLAGELAAIKQRLADQLLGQGVGGVQAAAFNPNSSDQVGDLLFTRFAIHSLKRTPGGDASTNDKVLEALEKDQHLSRTVRDIIAAIREYREIYKLKHTFTDKIPDHVNRWPHDGRIHATFRITRVVSGRLAASNPNLLALPKHGKFAKRFRQGFVAADHHTICSWDLSQIELRVLAHLSQDPVLLHAFRNGIDLHATLAERIFGVKAKDQDDSKHRLPAKAVNFGIPMGMTNIGLCLELRKNGVDINEEDAQRWLTETQHLYKEVPVYQQAKIAEARRFGFVSDLRGRRRYIGGIRSFDEAVRSEAERFAFSTPIQAGAQSIMKRAEGYLYTDVLVPRWKRGEWVEPLIQIHDDLLLEAEGSFRKYPHPVKPGKFIAVPDDLSLHQQLVHAMTQVPADDLSVPIETSGSMGHDWGSLYEIRESA